MQSLIRQGRFAEAAAVAWGTKSEGTGHSRTRGPVWHLGQCRLLINEHRRETGLACAEEGVAGTRDVPAILVHALAARPTSWPGLNASARRRPLSPSNAGLPTALDSPLIRHVRIRCQARRPGGRPLCRSC